MALLQFMSAGISRVRTPASVHVDHLITAKNGAVEDLKAAIAANKEVYEFLESACAKVRRASFVAGVDGSSQADELTLVIHSTASLSGKREPVSSIKLSSNNTLTREGS